MRILSQDGTIDLPYECIGITIGHRGDNEEFYIFAHLVNSAEPKKEPQKLGTYYTETKAQKAMEMLRETYLSRMELDGGYDAVNGCYVQPNFWVLPKVFQFPQDEDVEV